MNVTPSFDPIEKAKRNPRSLRLAINAKCWDCIGGYADPDPRRHIRECGCPACPLYNVRPYQKGADQEQEEAEG